MLKIKLLASLLLLNLIGLSQVQSFFVQPFQTDTLYDVYQDSSAIHYNPNNSIHTLFIFIGGTGSKSSSDYTVFTKFAAELGYHVINLNYPNAVAAASLKNNSDSLAFNHYRQELCFGSPLSDEVNIDSLNSIYTRILKHIQYLSMTYPSQNWGQYLKTPDEINWSRICVGGHSQGAGHACFIAKFYNLKRVLMFSGPNDYSDYFSNSANWLRQNGMTPLKNQFSYLSLNDEAFSFDKQFQNIKGLGLLTMDDSILVDYTTSPYQNSHCLYTIQKPGFVILNHNTPVKKSTINDSVWTYLFSVPTNAIEQTAFKNDSISIFPNPNAGLFTISHSFLSENLQFKIYNVYSQLIAEHRIISSNPFKIDISQYDNGIYFLIVNIDGKQSIVRRFLKTN